MKDEEFNKDDLCDGILNYVSALELDENPEAIVVLAVDSTLRYVIEWLQDTGSAAKAEILESIGE